MTVNPYTLNMLYQNGILDYVPTELYMPLPLGSTASMQNPYLNTAMQGNLYQQAGNYTDSFTPSGNYTGLVNTQIGSQSTNGIAQTFGFGNIGSESQYSMYGNPDIGNESQINFNSINGGLPDIKTGFSNGINKISSLPTAIKGILSAGLIILTLGCMFKGKKKKGSKTILQKLNPINWFKKEKPKPKPIKKTFWQKINPKNWCKNS